MAIAPDWSSVLDLELIDELLTSLGDYLPRKEHVLRAFEQPMSHVKVLVVGQDPYPTPGHAHGFAFSVAAGVNPLPPSLRNIFTEYCSDTGFPPPATGDLTSWVEQGVLLLNRTLTVAPGVAGSHFGLGWEEITQRAIVALQAANPDLVTILWGARAAQMQPMLKQTIVSPHPSPLSAYRGFFGSKPFTRANALLTERGLVPVEWRLP